MRPAVVVDDSELINDDGRSHTVCHYQML
jgi:hypothetical protein